MKEIQIQQSIILDDDIVALPAISLIYYSGKVQQATYDSFWFESQYTFIQNNRIIVKENSPIEFNDTLKIRMKDNLGLTTEVELIKSFVPLEEISVSTSIGKNECISGESVKIITELIPKNASNKKLLYEILQGDEYAEVSDDGVLNVKKGTPKNTQILLKVYSSEGAFFELCVLVTERTKINSAAQFISIRDNPYGDYSLEADINFVELSHRLPIPIFGGTLQGNGYDISNFDIEINNNGISRNTFYGLFGQLTGHVENFNIKNSSILFSDQNINKHNGSGWMSAGLVAGGGNGSISNVSVYNSKVEVHRYKSEIGGIAGGFKGKIQNCNVYNITLRGSGDQGGIAGGSTGLISGCRVDTINSADKNEIWHFSVNTSRSIGGLVGFSNGGTTEYSNVYNTDFILDGDAASEGIATKMGYGVGFQKGGIIHSISSGAENGNSKSTTLRSNINKTWQKSYFKLAWGQIGIVSNNAIIN